MAEYVYIPDQNVVPGQNVLLEDSIPCNKGYVLHRNGSGILTLRGPYNGGCCNRFARYQVAFNGNIAVPDGETPGEISLGIAIGGEVLQSSLARVTPTVAGAFFNVTSVAFITVPVGCCTNIAIENSSDIPVTVANANLVISRVA